MTAIDPTTSAATTTPTTQPAGAAATPQTSLDKNDFLKLLVAQLQHQDPMQPTDNTQFMAQLAQFSTLEQITNVGDEVSRLAAAETQGQSVAMIGHHVSYTDTDGTVASGTVSAVQVHDGKVVLEIGGAEVDPASLVSIAQ